MNDVGLSCKHCASNDVEKNGRYFGQYGAYQQYVCNTCGKKFSHKLEGPQEKRPEHPPVTLPPADDNSHPISWPAYNQAQVQEKLRFLEILSDLCSFIPEENGGRVGRPRASRREMAFCMVAKLYEGLSSRRVSSDLEIAMRRGAISRVPHFNTIIKYFNDPVMSPILEALIRVSALPLRDFETTFAVDASGLSSAFYSRWFDVRLDAEKRNIHDWIKIHVICGVKSNIVTAITVTDGLGADSPRFPELVRKTAENFRVKEVLADKAYCGRDNMQTVADVGGVPYIPFRKGTTGRAEGRMAWNKMFHYFQLHREEFMKRYHQRSNVESTFSMLKRKFSSKLRMKNQVAQVNEALAMVLCHNICVLVREACEAGISADFSDDAHLFPELHTKARKLPI